MKSTITLCAFSAACILSACAEVSSKAEAIAGPGQEVRYIQGASYVRSPGTEANVIANMVAEGDRMRVDLMIRNVSDHPIEFSEGLVTASENNTPVAVVTAEQLEKEAKRRDTWRRIAAGMAAGANAANAANAGRQTYSGSYTATNSYGHTINGTYVGQSYSPAAAQAAQTQAAAQNAEMVTSVNAAHASELKAIDGQLQRTTIDPNETIQGSITIDAIRHPRPSNTFELKVPLGSETHSLRFSEVRR